MRGSNRVARYTGRDFDVDSHRDSLASYLSADGYNCAVDVVDDRRPNSFQNYLSIGGLTCGACNAVPYAEDESAGDASNISDEKREEINELRELRREINAMKQLILASAAEKAERDPPPPSPPSPDVALPKIQPMEPPRTKWDGLQIDATRRERSELAIKRREEKLTKLYDAATTATPTSNSSKSKGSTKSNTPTPLALTKSLVKTISIGRSRSKPKKVTVDGTILFEV